MELSPNYNIYAMTPLWKPDLGTIITDESLFNLTVVSYTFWVYNRMSIRQQAFKKCFKFLNW